MKKHLKNLLIVKPIITYTPPGEESGIGVPSYKESGIGVPSYKESGIGVPSYRVHEAGHGFSKM